MRLRLRLEHEAVGLRRRSGEPTEESCEVALVAEPRPGADLDERHFTSGQQRLGAIDTELYQILVRRRARSSLKLPREMKGAHPGPAGQVIETQVAFIIVSDEIHHLPQLLARQAAREPLRASHRTCVNAARGERPEHSPVIQRKDDRSSLPTQARPGAPSRYC